MAEIFLLAGLSLAIVLRLQAGRARREVGLPPVITQAQGQPSANKRPAVGIGRGSENT